jgi:hypothetical protein
MDGFSEMSLENTKCGPLAANGAPNAAVPMHAIIPIQDIPVAIARIAVPLPPERTANFGRF